MGIKLVTRCSTRSTPGGVGGYTWIILACSIVTRASGKSVGNNYGTDGNSLVLLRLRRLRKHPEINQTHFPKNQKYYVASIPDPRQQSPNLTKIKTTTRRALAINRDVFEQNLLSQTAPHLLVTKMMSLVVRKLIICTSRIIDIRLSVLPNQRREFLNVLFF